MSALDEIKAKQKIERTALEWAVLICDETGGEATAMDAATQLSDLTTKLDLSQKENCNLRLEIQAVEANYDALQTPMPCGHLARYAVNGEEGTQYCVMCESNAWKAYALHQEICAQCGELSVLECDIGNDLRNVLVDMKRIEQ